MQETKPVIWKPLPGAQQKFLTCPHYEVLLEGNRGGGKTDALLMAFAQFVGRGFGSEWRGVIFRQTYPQLSDVINKSLKWFSQIFPSAKYNQTRHQWEFATGETLLFRFGESDLDYWNYHGHAYPFLGFEELTNWKDPAFYEAMQSTCRSTDPRVPRMVRATTNPFGKGHSWVKEHFRIGTFPPCVAFGKGQKKRVYIHSSLQENTILTTADPEYVETLKNLKEPARRAAWLEGSWDISVGTFLEKVWDPATCVVDPFPIPANWKVWKGMDWGYSKPYAVLWLAMNEEGTIFVWRELYGIDHDQPNVGSKDDAVKVASKIKQIEKHDSRYGYEYRANLADPAIFSNIGTSRSIGQIFRDAGVRWLPAWNGRGSRVNGAQEIVRLLAEGRLKFFKSCTNCIRTIPQLPPSDFDPEDVDTDAEDHCFTPDTLVMTSKGVRRIDSIGDALVLNRYGRWVTPCNWRIIKQSDIVKLHFEDGSTVVCTPDHKFLTPLGWLEAKDLEGKGVKAWKSKCSVKQFNGSTARHSIGVGNTFSTKDGACTALCGNTITEKFQTGTMWTKIRQTIKLAILSACPLRNTSVNTASRANTSELWRSPLNTRKRGMAQMKVGSGIKNTTKKQSKTSTRSSLVNVKSAVVSSNLQGAKANIAGQYVGPEISDSIILVTSVESAGKASVGCITVQDGESFCLANGSVAHNCWDALRYGVMRKRRAPNKDDRPAFIAESEANVGDGFISFDVDP